MRLLPVMGIVAVSAACAEEPQRAPQHAVPAEELTQQLDPEQVLELHEELRLGGGDDQRTSFFRVIGAAMDSQGELYVLDSGNNRVMVFDDDGDFVREFGREGQGPGEFRGPISLSLARDTLVVGDSENRVHFFTTRGEPVRTRMYHDLMTEGDGWDTSGVTATTKGWLLVANAYFRRDSEGRQGTLPPLLRVRLLWIDAKGDLSEAGFHWQQEPVGRWSGGFWVRPPYALRPAWAVDGLGRVHVADKIAYVIDVYSAEGRLIRRVVNEIARVPVDDEALDRWRAAQCQSGPECVPRNADIALSLPRPEFIPVVGSLVAFPNGHIAVRRADTDPDPFDRYVRGAWDLFDPEGRYMGRIESGRTPRFFDGHTLVVTERGSMDEEYVVRYRVGPPAS